MKITDMIISAILKKGIVYEARNADMEVEIPGSAVSEDGTIKENNIKVRFKCEHMTITIDKE